MTIKYALMATTAAVLLTTGGIASAQQSAPASRDAPAASKMNNAQGSAWHELKDGDSKVSAFGNIAVKDLNDYAIYGSDGKKIGDIDRVLADSSNTAKAVAVDAGGFLGMGTHEVVFPLDKLQKGKDNKQLTTAMTKDQIKALQKWEDASNDTRRAPGTATGAGGQPATSIPNR
jgi:hypothetical protein